ncbi:MAG TPA: serine/threonine-protein kinase [Tepidisphaeraceae bacterium]|nr:serine/threonine-protein kinase [Tepidisphaeraceae bacterium]
MTTATAVRARLGTDEIPRTLFDYEVLDFLGEGAGSLIYVVANPDTHQIYAMKHVRKRRDKDVRFFEQLETEYDVSRQFTHAALRRSLEYRDNRTLFRKATEAALVLELFDGMSLEARRPEDVVRTLSIFQHVAQGLASLHALGYAHCDLKPNNILVNNEGEVRIIDFGQACKLGTVKDRIQGTPDFIAPEQVRCQPVTARTDVFNFGATLYWTLTGQPIPTLYTLKKDENSFLVDEQITPPSQLNAAVPEPLSNLVMECIRTNPLRRPTDMVELARRLEIVQHVAARRSAAVA